MRFWSNKRLNPRIAAYAKKHIETGRTFQNQLPKHSNVPLLLAVEAYDWLLELEKHNFNILEPRLQKISSFTMPRKMLNLGSKGLY
jgi:hypothetical protein